jgi:hypothetical protein
VKIIWEGIKEYIKLVRMEKKYKALINSMFGSYWYDISEAIRRYENYRIRHSLGGNKGIHKI